MSDCQSGPTNGGRPVPINSRHPATDDSKLQSAVVNGIEVAAGDRVRLRPQQRADAVDLLLVGRTATVVSIEHDFEGRQYLAVTVDDDPGRDLGPAGWPGHRFFFRPDELEPLPSQPGGVP